MDVESLSADIKRKICDDIDVFEEGKGRLIVDTPFGFDDGDSFTIILKKDDNGWYLTDEGHTLMHLSYKDLDLGLEKGNRKDLFESIVKTHYMENDDGEFKCVVEDDKIGDTLYTFIQGLIKITDISFLKKESIRSLFMEHFKTYLVETFKDKCIFDYREQSKDPEGRYLVDCCINFDKPLFIFGLTSDSKCKDAVITCYKFKEWGVHFNSLGIFEAMGKKNPKIIAQCSDVIDKQFSSLISTQDSLPYYLDNMSIGMN